MTGAASTEPDLAAGNTAAYKGGQPSVTTMPDGDAAPVFNGATQYLSIPSRAAYSIPATGQLTWEAWIRPDTVNMPHNTGGYVNWMGKAQGYSPNCEWEARLYNQNTTRPSRLSAYAFNNTCGLGSGAYWQPADTTVIQPGRWYHVVGEYQTLTTPPQCDPAHPGTIAIWVNGVPWDSAVHGTTGCMSQYGITPAAASSPVNIATTALDSWFKGAIAKVAIYGTLLTQAQISAHYTDMTGLAPTGACTATCHF
jgi:hypothetical protein